MSVMPRVCACSVYSMGEADRDGERERLYTTAFWLLCKARSALGAYGVDTHRRDHPVTPTGPGRPLHVCNLPRRIEGEETRRIVRILQVQDVEAVTRAKSHIAIRWTCESVSWPEGWTGRVSSRDGRTY